MRAIWSGSHRATRAATRRFSGVRAEPRPRRPAARRCTSAATSPSSYRRAVTRGHGWYGFALGPAAGGKAIGASALRSSVTSDLPDLGPIEISVTPPPHVALDDATLAAYAALGVTRLIALPPRGRRATRMCRCASSRSWAPASTATGASAACVTRPRHYACGRARMIRRPGCPPWTAAPSTSTSARLSTYGERRRAYAPGARRGVRRPVAGRRRPARPRRRPRPLPAAPRDAGGRRRRRPGDGGRGPAAPSRYPGRRVRPRGAAAAGGGAGRRVGEQVPPAHRRGSTCPLALAGLHRALAVGGVLDITVFGGDGDDRTGADDDFPGRRFTWWQPGPAPRPARRRRLRRRRGRTDGADVDPPPGRPADRSGHPGPHPARHGRPRHAPARVRAQPQPLRGRRRASASPGPGNRFWPAALAAGIVTTDRVARPGPGRPRRRHDRHRQAGHAWPPPS